MLEVAYFGALRVSDPAGLTWAQVIPRETGKHSCIVGKGDKPRNILIPADLAAALRDLRADAPESERVFPISERRINYIVKATAKRAGINFAVSAHWLRHAHASHAIDEGAPITLVSQRRTRRPEDDKRLCPREAKRQLEPVPSQKRI